MRVVPEAREKAILWALTHIEAFTSGGADIGLTPELVAKFEAMALSFSEAALEVHAKRTAYRCQVNSANEIEKQFREVAATCISAIKSHAKAAPAPVEVYADARISPGNKPGSAIGPENAWSLTSKLQNDGTILLTWKGTTQRGQFFSVWRLENGGWVQIGCTGVKRYADTTIIPGTREATYMIRSHRGSKVSEGCEPITITFGRLEGLAA